MRALFLCPVIMGGRMGETTGGVLRRGSDRILGGVCSGLAVYFGLDVLLVRVVFVILGVAPPGIGIILYLVLWFLMEPPPGIAAAGPRNIGDRLRAMGDEIRDDFRSGFFRSSGDTAERWRGSSLEPRSRRCSSRPTVRAGSTTTDAAVTMPPRRSTWRPFSAASAQPSVRPLASWCWSGGASLNAAEPAPALPAGSHRDRPRRAAGQPRLPLIRGAAAARRSLAAAARHRRPAARAKSHDATPASNARRPPGNRGHHHCRRRLRHARTGQPVRHADGRRIAAAHRPECSNLEPELQRVKPRGAAQHGV